MFNPRPYLLVILLLVTTFLMAQGQEKFGKVNAADLAMTTLESDTSAEAYVLFDVSKNYFEVNGNNINFVTERHRRIKLFKRSSFDRADIELRRYKNGVRMSRIKAAIHLPNGKTIELKGKDMIKEDEDDDYELIKFTFPQVTEGAIIEYTYKRYSEYITSLPKYFFQEDIPVRWAEYLIRIPEYYNYISLSNANRMWDIDDSKKINGSLGSRNVTLMQNRNVLKDLPAYKDELYTNNFMDFIPHIYLQLAGVQYPQQPYEPVLKDWPTLAKEMDDFDSFGRAYNSSADVRTVLADIQGDLEKATTDMEKMEVAYSHITKHMSWNGDYHWGTESKLNKCWEAATGNSGEPNLILLAVLREMGIKAEPLLIGLRNRGSHVQVYPVISQFDHVMALAEVDGTSYILDAGSPFRPMGLPRYTALNNQGWVANPENPRWIKVDVPQMTRTTMATIDLAEDGNAEIQVQARMNGYYGFNGRETLDEMDDDTEGPLMEEILEVFPETELVNREVKEDTEAYGPLAMELDLKVPVGFAGDDFIYVSPVLLPVLTTELVDNEDRYTPIDMAYARKSRYIAKINIPEGYAVEELPESTRIRSQDNSVSCLFTISETGGSITLNLSVEINRPVFKAEEYQGLREVFQRIISIQESQIILKKAK